MAGPHHDAALGEQERGPERELVGPEQGGDEHVPARLEAPVHPYPHPVAQAVLHQHLLGLGEADLPGQARVLDRRQRARAGAAVPPADLDDVGERLGDACRDRSHAGLRNQLHRHVGPGVDLLQVEDELGEVLDRVDVVVRRRGDQRHARLGVAEPGDLLGHLLARDLPSLAGFGALRHLDVELLGERAVLRGHPEAARGDLLDAAVLVVVVARPVLAALAGVGPSPDEVHRLGDGLVGLLADGAVADRPAGEPPGDGGGGLDLVHGDGRPGGDEVEQVAGLGRGTLRHQLGERGVGLPVAVLHGLMQGVDDGGVRDVVLDALGVVLVVAGVEQLRRLGEGHPVAGQDVLADGLEADAAEGGGAPGEAGVDDLRPEADGVEDLRPPVGIRGGDAHLREDLEDALLHGVPEPHQCLGHRDVLAEAALAHQVGDRREHQRRAHRLGPVAE